MCTLKQHIKVLDQTQKALTEIAELRSGIIALLKGVVPYGRSGLCVYCDQDITEHHKPDCHFQKIQEALEKEDEG